MLWGRVSSFCIPRRSSQRGYRTTLRRCPFLMRDFRRWLATHASRSSFARNVPSDDSACLHREVQCLPGSWSVGCRGSWIGGPAPACAPKLRRAGASFFFPSMLLLLLRPHPVDCASFDLRLMRDFFSRVEQENSSCVSRGGAGPVLTRRGPGCGFRRVRRERYSASMSASNCVKGTSHGMGHWWGESASTTETAAASRAGWFRSSDEGTA